MSRTSGLARLLRATTDSVPGLSLVSESGVLSSLRCAGDTSTSYSHGLDSRLAEGARRRWMSGKGAKGKAAPAGKAAAAPPPAPPKQQHARPQFPGALLAHKRKPQVDPLSLLTPEQQALAQDVVSRAARMAGPGANTLAQQQAGAEPVSFQGMAQLGLPLSQRDAVSLLHQSLTNAAGQNVQFQPVVFSNLFQSASAVASYVAAAMEGGAAWGRVERFFLASVEATNTVRGIRVAVRGRLGRKAGKAGRKVWEWGDVSLRTFSDAVDYGMATAHTRMGALGVKVWIRYHPGAVQQDAFPSAAMKPRPPPQDMSLDKLYATAARRDWRLRLPYDFSHVAWWTRPGTEQPAENRPWEALADTYQPGVAGSPKLRYYLANQQAPRFKSLTAWKHYAATRGRYLERQRVLLGADRWSAAAPAAAAGQAWPAALLEAAALGRRAKGRRLAPVSMADYRFSKRRSHRLVAATADR